ncbi:MAG: ABC transporter permease, partial [Actinomycetes bacterium]
MVTAALRKSLTDLTRRRARTLFTITTLALAVASIALLAVPTLINRSMRAEVTAERLAHLTVTMKPMRLTDAQLSALSRLPNVEAVEPRSGVDGRIYVGGRRAPLEVIGVRDFARQKVEVVQVTSGTAPADGAVLVDVQDANQGVYGGRVGDDARVIATGKTVRKLPISGEARNLGGGQDVVDDNLVVLYTSAATVATLGGDPGYGQLELRLKDTSPAAVTATAGAVRDRLQSAPGFTGFTDLPEVRAANDWPGKAEAQQFSDFFGVITVLALLSALVLIANTMTTLVAEQVGEIGIMRAIGARRRQIAQVYLRTALMLGVLGALVGIALGIVLSNLLARFFGSTFFAIDVGVGVDVRVLLVSLAVGVVGPPLAALPAIRRGVRVDLREALESTGSAVGGQDSTEQALRRVGFLPRTMQIGLRGVGRRRRRSLATVLIVALAVGNLLAVLGLADAASQSSRTSWGDHLEDVRIWTTGRALFDEHAAQTIRATPGVAAAQPALVNSVTLAGADAFVWGVPRRPLFHYRTSEGRWFSAAEERARTQVAVIEQNLARSKGVTVGDRVTLATAAGTAQLRIVGISRNQQEDGNV